MRYLFQPLLLSVCGALALVSCSFRSKSDPLPPQVPIISPNPGKLPPDAPLPTSPEPDSKSIALTFRVDPKHSVGTIDTTLDIPVTDDVLVSGTCLRDGNQMKLHIPAAVLRDHYDMGEATLDLVFTGDIVATCPAPRD